MANGRSSWNVFGRAAERTGALSASRGLVVASAVAVVVGVRLQIRAAGVVGTVTSAVGKVSRSLDVVGTALLFAVAVGRAMPFDFVVFR